MAQETVTVTVEADGEQDEVAVPEELIDVLGEGEDGAHSVVADLAVLGLAQQAHGIIHHSPEPASDDLRATEDRMMELFEERFGQSYAEMTNHSH